MWWKSRELVGCFLRLYQCRAAASRGFPSCFGNLSSAIQLVGPAFRHAFTMFGSDLADRTVNELEPGCSSLGNQPVLNVIHAGVRHEQRTGNLQQRGRLDDLDVTPEMAGLVT